MIEDIVVGTDPDLATLGAALHLALWNQPGGPGLAAMTTTLLAELSGVEVAHLVEHMSAIIESMANDKPAH